jgi:hypothetical protein
MTTAKASTNTPATSNATAQPPVDAPPCSPVVRSALAGLAEAETGAVVEPAEPAAGALDAAPGAVAPGLPGLVAEGAAVVVAPTAGVFAAPLALLVVPVVAHGFVPHGPSSVAGLEHALVPHAPSAGVPHALVPHGP